MIQEEHDKRLLDMQSQIDREIQEKQKLQDKLQEEASLEVERKLKEVQDSLRRQLEKEMADKMQALDA